MPSYQFSGKDAAVKAFQNRGTTTWAIFQGKCLNNKGTGDQELDDYLEMISGGSNIVYTLKVYDDITDPKLIKEKTEADGSFNFILADDYKEPRTERTTRSEMFQRIRELEAKVTEKEEPAIEEETIGSVFMGLLKNPSELSQLVQVIQMLGLLPPQPAQQQLQPVVSRIGNIENRSAVDDKIGNANYSESVVLRLGAAVDTLEKNDPKLVDHLEKLAMIAQNRPDQFKFLLAALEQM